MAEIADDELFSVIAHLVTSAALAPDETLTLASFRLLHAASMLITAREGGAGQAEDQFLDEVARQFQEHFGEVMVDEDRYLAWTRQLCAQVAREARDRQRRRVS
ncbi:MAG TPA: DUF6092 family protein [Streptosporangiaceae bacterium]|jgi:hypothetical protein